MKKILSVLFIFVLLSFGIVVFVLSRTKKVTNDLAEAAGSTSIELKDFLDSCDVFLDPECGNSATSESVSVSYAAINKILSNYPQSKLTTYYEAVPTGPADTRQTPPKDTAAHLLIQAGREEGVSFRVLLALMTSVGNDPLRRADADIVHPFGTLSAEDGFYAQVKDIAKALVEMRQKPEYTLHIGNKNYDIPEGTGEGSVVLYQFLASALNNPEKFEHVVLPKNARSSDNLFFIWQNVLGDKLITD